MSKPSKKSLPLKLHFDVEQLNGCCGVGELLNFSWVDKRYYRRTMWGSIYDPPPNVSYETNPESIESEFKRATKSVLRSYPAAICTMIDKYDVDRDMLTGIRKAGWKEVMKSPSKHGRGKYNIYTFCIQRPEKKKKNNAV